MMKGRIVSVFCLTLLALPLLAASGTQCEQANAKPTDMNVPRVGQTGVEPPVFTKKIAPDYPKAGVDIGLQGYVILECVLGKNGKVRSIEVLRGLGKGAYGFEKAAAEAVSKWQFLPGKVDGKPASVRMTLKIDFVLSHRKLQLVNYDARGESLVKKPGVKLDTQSYGNIEGPSVKLPVTFQVDEDGTLLHYFVDSADLAAFAYPEQVRAELERMIDYLTFKPAVHEDGARPTDMIVEVELPLKF